MRTIRSLCVLLLVVCTSAIADAPWPSKPLRFVVPWPAGGAADAPARLLAEQLATALGQSVVVDNRVGAGGNIGTDAVAKSPPDGYTLLLANVSTIATNPYLYRKLPFDPFKDLAPVTLTSQAPLILAVNPEVPAATMAELITYAKANPGKLSFGSSGIGGSDHLAGELFKTLTGTSIIHVPYKGGIAAQIDLIAGRTQMQFVTYPGAVGHFKTGRLRPIAVVGDTRFALLPDVPTLSEAGIADFNVVNWFGVMVAAGTPPAIVKRLNAELVTALQSPQTRSRFLEMGVVPVWSSPDGFASYVKASASTMEKIVRVSGATAE